MELERRVENLEAVVRLLRDEIAALRTESRGAAVPSAGHAPAAAHDRAPAGVDVVTPAAADSGIVPSGGAPRPAAAASTGSAFGAPAGAPVGAYPPSAAVSPFGAALRPSSTADRRPSRSSTDQLRQAVGQVDVESFLGRYGTLALGALALLMALGAWLSWAIANDRLGPGARVGLGALAAALVAGVGVRLRRRGTTRFGNTLLGIALALVHVNAWGAGPELGVVSPMVALGVAAVASVALAVLAWRAAEQALFIVGVGGALVAPFVAGADHRDAFLLAYGAIVLAGALWALRDRRWVAAARVVTLATAAYAVASVGNPTGGWLAGAEAGLVFALGVLAAALALGARGRLGRVPRSLAYVAVIPALAGAVALHDAAPGLRHLALAAALGLLAHLALLEGADDDRWTLDALVLPLATLGAALAALPDASSTTGALLALGWTAAGAAAALVAGPAASARRAALLAAAGLALATAIACAAEPGTLAAVGGLAGLALLASWVLARERQPLLALPAVAAAGGAALWAYELLAARLAYQYTPFLTGASLAALAACIAWWAVGRAVVQVAPAGPAPRADDETAGVAGHAAWLAVAFLWGREELAYAGSFQLSTFLLIGYYAGTGLLAIFVGRWRQVAALRRVGLALAIYGALKAVLLGSSQAIALRVGSYLIVGCFLLAVAYWYRAAGSAGDDDAAPASPA